jgi:hypothetical protein
VRRYVLHPRQRPVASTTFGVIWFVLWIWAKDQLINSPTWTIPRPDAARRAARGPPALGRSHQLRETHRELHGLPWIETLFQDLRYAFRVLRKNPAFTAVAVLTLALGIGANTAIFSVVYAVLLKPLPYANPDQLVIVFEEKLAEGITKNGSSYLDFVERREQNRSFRELAGTQTHNLTLTGRGEPSVVDTAVVTPELFSLPGVRPLAGRTFLPEDGVKGASPVVILSENFWSSRFGADPKIVGSPITLDKRSFTVVGIMPAAFRMMLAESGKLVLLGLAFGIPAALVLARFLSGLLFAVHSTDPLTFVGVIILLSLVALAASYVPTRRAVRAGPMVALRCE